MVKIRLIVILTTGLTMIGCGSTPSARSTIDSARMEAYSLWQSHRANPTCNETRISGKLCLEDALKISLQNNKALLAVMQEKDVARGRVLASHAGLLPTIKLLGSYTRHEDDPLNKNVLGSLDEYSTGITVAQPLFRGGATRAEIRSAHLFACLSDERIRGQYEDTIYAVTHGFYRVLLAQQLLKVTQDAVKSADAYFREVSSKRAIGAATEYDVLRARVDVSLYQAEMIRQQNELNLAKTQLLQVMGVSQESEIDLSGKLVYRSIASDFERAVEQAYFNRPDLKQRQADIYLQEEAVRITTSHYWPQVNAFFTQRWGRPDLHASLVNDWGGDRVAGVSLEWSVFDGLQREGRLVEDQALLCRRRIELLDAQEKAVLEVRQALLSLQDAEEFVETQKMNLDYAREGLRLADEGYREGINTEVDVTDARASLTRAQGLYYQAIYDHALARLLLQKATGFLSPNSTIDEKETPDGQAAIGARVGGDNNGIN